MKSMNAIYEILNKFTKDVVWLVWSAILVEGNTRIQTQKVKSNQYIHYLNMTIQPRNETYEYP